MNSRLRPTLPRLLSSRPRVEELEPRTVLSASGADFSSLLVPTDSYYGSLWNMPKIKAPAAWDVTTGKTSVLVAVNDTGIDYTHPDLYRNIWINQNEIPTAQRVAINVLLGRASNNAITFWDLNADSFKSHWSSTTIKDVYVDGRIDGRDLLAQANQGGWADGQGSSPGDPYVDDLIGWDFVNHDNNPLDDNGHGTHVAGTIGASANDGGVVGLNWQISLVAIKISGSNGTGSWAQAAEGITYGVNVGAKISNNSYGGSFPSAELTAAVNYAEAKGQLFIASSGNDAKNNDTWYFRRYPASYPNANVVSVTATDVNDKLPRWANVGKTSVDLAAPGVNVLSTVPTFVSASGYAVSSGTSMASPHVAGAAALLLARNDNLTTSALRSALLNNVDKVAALTKNTVTGGRLNVAKALNSVPAGSALTTLSSPAPRLGATLRLPSNATTALAMTAVIEAERALLAMPTTPVFIIPLFLTRNGPLFSIAGTFDVSPLAPTRPFDPPVKVPVVEIRPSTGTMAFPTEDLEFVRPWNPWRRPEVPARRDPIPMPAPVTPPPAQEMETKDAFSAWARPSSSVPGLSSAVPSDDLLFLEETSPLDMAPSSALENPFIPMAVLLAFVQNSQLEKVKRPLDPRKIGLN